MQTIGQDVRYAWRGLLRRPGFATLAVLTLALGIGAATTVFSVIQNVLIDPFPYPGADRFINLQIRDTTRARPGGRTFFETSEFLDYQEQNAVFDEVIAGTVEDVLQATHEGTEQFAGGLVSPNMFRFLGVPPHLGRWFTEEDARPDAPPVFVMSHRMWAGRYNADPTVVGRTFILNGVATTCIGITPPRFFKLAAELYRPVVLTRANPDLKGRFFMFQARLKPGVTHEEATADLDVIAHRLATVYPRSYPKQFKALVLNWSDNIAGTFKTTLYTLAAAVALLLLIGCSNVANMLLAHGAAREREIAIRVSVGAGRGRIVRQLLVESLVLAFAGAVVGCVFAHFGLRSLVVLMPEGLIPREAEIRLNVPVLAFSLLATIATAIIFGLAPAIQTARRNLVESLKSSGKSTSGGFRRGALRNALVVAEVAFSLVLLAGAALLMRSFVNLTTADLGFNPDNVLAARLPLPRGQYDTVEAKHRFFQALLPRLQSLPGVVAVTETTNLPPYGGIRSEVEIPGKPQLERRDAAFQLCSEGYFATLGLQLIRGRTLSEVDIQDARRVAVVNQTLVNRFFGDQDPIGQRIKLSFLQTLPTGAVPDPVFEVVGVTSDARNAGLLEPPMPEAFIPYTTTGAFERGVLVRTSGDPAALLNAVRREIWRVDRNVAVTSTGPLTEFLARFSYAEPRFALVLLGVFASLGLVLVAVGVYSVIAYTVSRQTQEIGIRMALGARRGDVLGMVARSGLRLVGIGIVIGIIASLGLTRVLSYQLHGISPHDPITLAGVAGVMILAGAAATYFPARRATLVDPLTALRSE